MISKKFVIELVKIKAQLSWNLITKSKTEIHTSQQFMDYHNGIIRT